MASESSTHIVAMDFGRGRLITVFRSAAANMAGWIAEDNMMTPAEMAELFGMAAEYGVREFADRNTLP